MLGSAANAWLAGRADRAVELLGQARKLTRSAAVAAEIDALDGHIAMRRGAVLEGHRMLVAAATATAETDRRDAIRMLGDAALSSFGAGRPEEMLPAARQALDLLRPDDPPEPAAIAHVACGALAIMAGHGADGPETLRASLAIFDRIEDLGTDPLLLTSAGLTGLFLREAETGRDLLERDITQAR